MERGRSSKISMPADWSPGRSAPDGGWGWVVVVAVGFVFIVTIGPMGSFGLIFGDFLENIGAGTSDVTFINGLYFALSFLPGVLANRVLQLYTCRQVVLVGGTLFFFGSFLSAFANSVAFMVITFSVIQGTGLGLLLPASFTCLNKYFLRRRTQAMGAAQLLVAVGVMLYPLLIETLMETVGFRGTQAVLAALSLHTIVGALTMQSLDFNTIQRRKKSLKLIQAPDDDSPRTPRKCTKIRIEEEGEGDSYSSREEITPVYYYDKDTPHSAVIEQDIPEVDETAIEYEFTPEESETHLLLPNNFEQTKNNMIRSQSVESFTSESAANNMFLTVKSLVSPRTHSFDSINPTTSNMKPTRSLQILDYLNYNDPTLISIKSMDITRKDSVTLSRQMFTKPALNPDRSFNYLSENSDAFNNVYFRKRKISDNKQHVEAGNLVISEHLTNEGGGLLKGTSEEVDGCLELQEKSTSSLCNGPRAWTNSEEDLATKDTCKVVGKVKLRLPDVPDHQHEVKDTTRHKVHSPAPERRRPARKRQVEHSRRRPSMMTTISVCSSSDSISFGSSDDSYMNPPRRQRKYSVVSWTADCMDLGLLRDVVYVNIILGVSFSVFSDNMFLNLQPLFYHELGFTGGQAAACVALNSAADLFGRMGFVVFGSFLTNKSRWLLLLGSAGTVVVRTVFILSRDYTTISALTAVLGFFRSWINVCTPLVFAEYTPVERFPAAYGLYLLTTGLIHLFLGPFVGLIRDVSGSYPTCLAAITALMLVCVVPWTIEFLLTHTRRLVPISDY